MRISFILLAKEIKPVHYACWFIYCLFNGDDFVLEHQFFIEEKPPFYCFANETKNMTGAEVIAGFEAEST